MKSPAFDIGMIHQTVRLPDLQSTLNFSFGFGGQNAIIAFGNIE
ncbi:MAG: hypothetical protein ACKPCM_08730 [Pseudanabaena sp.]